jgi:hypothetical protein
MRAHPPGTYHLPETDRPASPEQQTAADSVGPPPRYHAAFSPDRIWLPSVVKGFVPAVSGCAGLAGVKQRALDSGCGSAWWTGVGNASKNGRWPGGSSRSGRFRG